MNNPFIPAVIIIIIELIIIIIIIDEELIIFIFTKELIIGWRLELILGSRDQRWRTVRVFFGSKIAFLGNFSDFGAVGR